MAAYATGGYASLTESVKALLRRELNVDILMILAATGSGVAKHHFSLAVIVMLVVSVFLFELPLPLGVVGHEDSTLLVVLNGLRLLRP